MYANGRGVREDDAEAVRLYRVAAERGLAAAQVRLGLMYDEGRGVSEDPISALMWLNLAARQDADGDFVAGVHEAVAAEMTSAEITEADRLADEWKPSGPR